MRLIFLFLFAIAAALSSAHAQTPLVFTSNATLPSSPAGSPASIPVQITGGTQPYSFNLKKGHTLPTGLTLNNSTGVISGTPRGPSSTEIQVQVRDSGAPVRYKAKNFILTISGDAPALPTFKVIPSVAQVDKPFSFTLNATKGKTPYTFTTNSTLPAGLTLSPSGTLSGTPLLSAAPQASKDYKIVVRVVGSNAIPQSSTRTYTLTVAPAAPPVITTKTIPDAEMGEEYLFDDLVVTGGKPPYKFKAAAVFPAGLTIAEDGTISGIPKTAGPYRLRISATDANNRTGTAYVSLIVSDAPTPKITTATTLYWTRNQTVSTTLAATAGRAPYKWAKTGKSTDPLRNLPDGVTLNQNGTFSGTPTVANTFTVPIRVTDDLGKGSTKTFTIIVSTSSLAITSPEVLEPAYVGVSPNLNLTAQGGIAPFTWTLKNRGTLPSTITLSSAGRLSGTANATGNFSFTAEVADSRNGTVAKVEKQLTLPVINYNLAISTTSLPAGSAGSNYPVTPLVATGGKPPYTWSFTSTPALSGLSASTGNLTGKPAAAGNYTLALKVTDANSRSVTSNLTLRVNEPDALAFDPLTLPNGRVGTSYNGTLGAKGGFSPYTFTLKTGNALPAGLSLASATGAITGKPTTTGTFKFIVVLKDSKKPTAATIEREFTVVIDAYGMSIDGPATITGKRYSSITPAQFTVTGGTANYTWSATPTLASALNLDSKTGLVSGDLTAAVGNYTVAIKVTDGNRQFATRNLTVSITQPDPVVWVTPATLPEGQVGGNYTAVEFAASGGKAPYTYALKTGNRLPSGLALSAGKISGTPRASGTFKFTLIASDSQSPTKATAEREFTLVIKPAVPLAITAPNPMPSANVGSVYSPASFTASGGLPPYTWSVTPSPAAPGLTFSGGNLTGTPTTAGNYTFTVRVVDSASANATRTITLPVGALIPLEWVTPSTLPGGQVLTTYNATLTTRGGTAPVTITRISGNLSAGLTQSGTRISGTPTAVGNATFTLQARDKNGVTANRTFTLPVAPYDLSVSADSPSVVNGTVNQPLSSDPFNADGGDGDYSWSISGTKPSWLSINRDSGVLSGTSNATGNWTVNVVVTDGNRQTANKTCTVLIGLGEPPLLDTTQQLPAGMVGVPYPNPAINAEGGLEPYRFTVKNGSGLPAGLSINATTGIISGTPTAAGNTTTTIVVTGANGASAERAYTIRIDAYDLAISSEVPWVLQGQVYKDFGPLPLEATGGLESYKWSMTPASTGNLTLDASGTLTGRPATAGNFSVTFRVVDARNATVTKNATIQIAPAAPLEFTTEPNLPNGKVATPYGGDVTILPVPTPVAGVTLAGKGGLAPYTYSFKTGSTPPSGLNLSTAGKISGTPSAAGTFKFFVVIKDSKNTTAEREFTLVVEPYGMAISENAPVVITGNQHQPLTPTQFSVTGGRPAYVWSSSPTPPAGGLTLNATTGILSGVPTTAGNTTIAVRVTDGVGQTATRNCTIRILPAANLTITTASPLPSGSMNASYSTTLTATGGKPFLTANQSIYYNWTIANRGNLPTNFTLNATTGILSGTANAVLTANFTVRVTDAANVFATKNCSLQITAPMDTGDADGDGVNNYREAYDGTDPFDNKSFNPLSVGLVAHYPFEGNAKDESGYSKHGTIISGGFEAGRFGNSAEALSIAQDANYTRIPLASTQFNGDLSIVAYVKFEDFQKDYPIILFGENSYIVLHGLGPAYQYINKVQEVSYLEYSRWTGGDDWERRSEIYSSKKLTAKQWYQICITRTADSTKIFVDGELCSTASSKAAMLLSGNFIQVGKGYLADPNQSMRGAIDDLKFYNRALSAAEVSQLYSEESGGRYSIILGNFTWEQAKADAEARGGHLATITSNEEWQKIQQELGSSINGKNLWLGATDSGQEGFWKWITGEPWGFTRWQPGGEPNGYTFENYLAIDNRLNNNTWNDLDNLANQRGDQHAIIGYLYESDTYAVGKMVTVQGGTLPAGSALANQTVQAFQIGRTEVTWEEWKAIRTWAVANGYTDLASAGAGGETPSLPARLISWYEAVKWCNAKSEMEGLEPVYRVNGAVYRSGKFGASDSSDVVFSRQANGYRLPEEAEWEWAAMGGAQSKSYSYSGSNNIALVARYNGNSAGSSVPIENTPRGPWPVAQFLPNELGIYDFSGGILEWTWDGREHRRLAGGCWNFPADECTPSSRYGSYLDGPNHSFGFRLARNIGPKISISGTLPEVTLNQAYAGYTFGVVGSTGDKVWSISEGTLPPGMSFSATGTLSGTPTTAGTYTFVIRLESGGYWDEVEVELEVVDVLKYDELVTVMGGKFPLNSSLAGSEVKEFRIGKYEVPLILWNKVLEYALKNGYQIISSDQKTGIRYPVANINWYDVMKWCNAKSEMEGLVPVYQLNGGTYKAGEISPLLNSDANGYRLPYEKEWEWAARGGVKSNFYSFSGSNQLDLVAWNQSNSLGYTKPVGSKASNELELYDMSGNVIEWMQDKIDSSFAFTGFFIRVRGGSIANSDAMDFNISYKSAYNYPFSRQSYTGFRLARNSPSYTGIVSTIAGLGIAGGINGNSTSSTFDRPNGIAMDGSGNFYISEYGGNRIRKITSAGVISTLAGSGNAAYADGSGVFASFNQPQGLDVDDAGNIYVVEANNNRIRKISPAGEVTTLAGSGGTGSTDGTGVGATFNRPFDLVRDSSGNLYISDCNNNKIRKITLSGIVTTFAGSGSPGATNGTGAAATFNGPRGIVMDNSGNLFVADVLSYKIRKISPAGVVTTFAGSGTNASVDGTGTAASFNEPSGLAIDSSGNLYVGETGAHKIRKITPAGEVTTLAGAGTVGLADGTGSAAKFNGPYGLVVDADGNLIVADTENHKIRKVSIVEK